MLPSFNNDDIISYMDMCRAEGASLHRGMNFRLGGTYSVILMSVRRGAPYEDSVQDNGQTLIYEGHDIPKSKSQPYPKTIDQVLQLQSGKLTQNGLFYKAAKATCENRVPSELVRVYEKILDGIWSFKGVFQLIDAWQQASDNRKVFKFKLRLFETTTNINTESVSPELLQTRIIPTEVKLEVWKRDGGKCSQCGATDQLHFDHILPYSKGGTSLTSSNIQLLCIRHNLEKRDKII